MAANDLICLPFHSLHDTEFLHAIFEQQHGSVHFDSDRLLSRKFNPNPTFAGCPSANSSLEQY